MQRPIAVCQMAWANNCQSGMLMLPLGTGNTIHNPPFERIANKKKQKKKEKEKLKSKVTFVPLACILHNGLYGD